MSMMIDASELPSPGSALPLTSPGPALVGEEATPVSETAASPDYFLPQLVTEPRGYRRVWLVTALLITALFARVVFGYFASGDDEVDQNAYLVGGRLLATHFSMKYTLPNPYAYTGGMFVRMTPPTINDKGNPATAANGGKTNPNGVYFPKYPFGLPLLYACVLWVFKLGSALPILRHHVEASQGVYWAFIISPASAVASVAGMFFLARLVSGSFAATLAAILLGTSQLMLTLADNPNSHSSCLAFIVWGMFFCLRWLQTGSTWRGILGGLLVGYAATIRYNEILLFVVMCVVVLSRLPWNQWKTYLAVSLAASVAAAVELIVLNVENLHAFKAATDERWSSDTVQFANLATTLLIIYAMAALAICVTKLRWPDWRMYLRAMVPGLAWAVPVGILLLVNRHTMGSTTGYDSTNESKFGVAFQWKFFWQNWEKVLREFYDMGLFFVVPFAVAGIVMLFRRSWRVAVMLLAWLVPGVVLYMSYYWSPDFADAYARFFLTYLPALLVGAAVCFHDGLLAGRKDSTRAGSIALTLAVAMVVAIGAGVSSYRTVHGLRDGSPRARIPLNDFRARLSLAQTGQVLLEKVPAKSVLFAENTGGIATPANFIQFVGDWELYAANVFSIEGSRQGMGGGGGRQNQNGRGGGGRGNLGGGRGGGPPGGGPGGAFGGGPGGGLGGGGPAGNNANAQKDPNAVATPMQDDQLLYHASLYSNKSPRQLYQLQADVVHKAFQEGRRVFVAVANDHPIPSPVQAGVMMSNRFTLFGNDNADASDDALSTFEQNLNETGKYRYKAITRWADFTLPEDKEEDLSLTDNNPMGAGRGGMGMNVGRIFMGSDRVMDWQLVEVLPPAVK